MTDAQSSTGTLSLFRGPHVWGGIALALAGLVGEEVTNGEMAFEYLMFFGGFQLGMGVMQNRFRRVETVPA